MNVRMWRYGGVAACAIVAMTLAGCSKSPETSDSASNKVVDIFKGVKSVTLPEGSAIPVVLDQALSSKDARAGDPFEATVIEPVVVDGKTVIPKDARAKGHVVEARTSGRLQTVARLSLTLDSVEAGGKSYDIRTSSITRTGGSHNKRNVEFIGGGSALGAIIGGIAGHGKGAAIGAAAGAGAGTAAAAATGKKDVSLPAEAALTFRLTRPVTVQVKAQ